MRIGLLLGLLALGGTTLAGAQATRDQARLVFTVAGAFTGRSSLWEVAGQPVARRSTGLDTLDLQRRIRSTLGLMFSGMYFPRDVLGLGVEAFLIGIGFVDDCRITSLGAPDPRTQDLCGSIDGQEKSASAVLVSAGPVFRVNSRRTISPYFRVQPGLVVASQSPIRTEGTLDTGDRFIVYRDEKTTRITPGVVFGLGMTAQVGKGYQLRWEIRDNYVGLATVEGPTARDGALPSFQTSYKHLWSVVVGFDVVLERRRGRRY